MLLAVGCALCADAAARISWLKTTLDFGAFNENQGPVTARMPYVNTGDEELVIIAARASCGCTTPRFDKTELAPGDTAYLTVTFDPAGRPGRFNKKITVDTNTEPRRSTLHVTGVVIGAPATVAARYPVEMGPLRLSASTALLGTAQKMHAKTVFIDGYNATGDSITPRIADTPRWLDVSAGPRTVPPGERVAFNFLIRPDNSPLYGMVADSVTVIPDVKKPEVSFRLPVVVTFEDDFSKLSAEDYRKAPVAVVSDSRLNLGKESKGHFAVSNKGKSPLLIRRIYTLDHGLGIGKWPAKIKPGKSASIDLTVEPSGTPATVGKVIIITNDPVTPVQTLTVTSGSL